MRLDKLLFYFVMAFLVVGAVGTMAQTTECVEVPDNHKIVFVPWIIPADQLRWTWRAAKEVPEPEPEPRDPVECTGDLVVSPSVCDE